MAFMSAIISLVTLVNIVASSSAEYGLMEFAQLGRAGCMQVMSSWEKNFVQNCTFPWTYCANGTCKCGDIHKDMLQCHLDKSSTISHCYCVTFDETTGLTSAGNCIYNCGVGKRKDSDNLH